MTLMKPNGRKALVLVEVVLLVLFLAACPGLSDWEYALPNGYEIIRVNSQAIVFGKIVEGSFDQLINRYILAFCFNEQYIWLQRYPVDPNRPWEDHLYIHEVDTTNPEYYLVDTVTEDIYGPYTMEEYGQKIEDLCVTNMSEWIVTETKPE